MHGQSTVKRVVTSGVVILIGTLVFVGGAFATPASAASGMHATRVEAGTGQSAAPACNGTPSSTNASAGNGAGCTGSTDAQATTTPSPSPRPAGSEVSLAPAVSAARGNGTSTVAAATSNDAPGRPTEVLGTQVRRTAPALARTGKSTVPLLVLGTALCLLGFGLVRLAGDKAYR
jgi:hypothetical protein